MSKFLISFSVVVAAQLLMSFVDAAPHFPKCLRSNKQPGAHQSGIASKNDESMQKVPEKLPKVSDFTKWVWKKLYEFKNGRAGEPKYTLTDHLGCQESEPNFIAKDIPGTPGVDFDVILKIVPKKEALLCYKEGETIIPCNISWKRRMTLEMRAFDA